MRFFFLCHIVYRQSVRRDRTTQMRRGNIHGNSVILECLHKHPEVHLYGSGKHNGEPMTVVNSIPAHDQETFQQLRHRFVETNEISLLKDKLLKDKFIYQNEDGNYVLSTKNIFTKLSKQTAGILKLLPSLKSYYLNEQLGPLYKDKFFVCSNLPLNDYCYDVEAFESTASMSRYHCFLVLKNNDDLMYSNVLFFGLDQENTNNLLGPDDPKKTKVLIEGNMTRLIAAIQVLREMKEAAYVFVLNMTTKHNSAQYSFMRWENADPLCFHYYFHAYPFNSIHSLHMHIVSTQKEHAGSALQKHKFKNLEVDTVIKQLELELESLRDSLVQLVLKSRPAASST